MLNSRLATQCWLKSQPTREEHCNVRRRKRPPCQAFARFSSKILGLCSGLAACYSFLDSLTSAASPRK